VYPLRSLTYRPDDVCLYFSFNAVQGVVEPFTPLGLNALRHALTRGLPFHRPPEMLMPDAGGRLFIDITDLVRDPLVRKVVLAFLARADAAARQALLQLLSEGRVSTQRAISPVKLLLLPFVARHPLARAIG